VTFDVRGNYDRAGPMSQRLGTREDVRTRTHTDRDILGPALCAGGVRRRRRQAQGDGYAGLDVRRQAKEGLDLGPCERVWPK